MKLKVVIKDVLVKLRKSKVELTKKIAEAKKEEAQFKKDVDAHFKAKANAAIEELKKQIKSGNFEDLSGQYQYRGRVTIPVDENINYPNRPAGYGSGALQLQLDNINEAIELLSMASDETVELNRNSRDHVTDAILSAIKF